MHPSRQGSGILHFLECLFHFQNASRCAFSLLLVACHTEAIVAMEVVAVIRVLQQSGGLREGRTNGDGHPTSTNDVDVFGDSAPIFSLLLFSCSIKSLMCARR